ncbi:MAG: hypothetical protein HYY16_07425 [Planctomycetes bacterium]|nr:hypothetical protein [Planctomycetota bacterium]
MIDLPQDWSKALYKVQSRLRELISSVPERGLDPLMEGLEELAVSVWILEGRGVLRERADDVPIVNHFADAFPPPLHKVAPAPPKKLKRNIPPRKILPLSEAGAVRALDAIMLVRALVEIGDYTRQTDKARTNHLLFLDDWRRMVWESARIPSWDRLRELTAGDPPFASQITHVRFSRRAVIDLLQAVANWRADLITPIPNVSMIFCQRCGRHEGRERIRCGVCAKLFCGKCFSRTADLCLIDYAKRYETLSAETRATVSGAALEMCRRYRLDEFTRNAAFAKALEENGVQVVFHETAPESGEEIVDNKGNFVLRLRDRENATAKKILFAALARCHFRAAESTPDDPLVAYFVDTCLGIPLEEILGTNPTPQVSSPKEIPTCDERASASRTSPNQA